MSVTMQPIYVLASGGSRAMEQLDVQANNLANVNTPGFKKVLMTEMSQAAPKTEAAAADRLVFPRFSESVVLQQQGAMIKTGAANDLALSGSGYFEVLREDETVLTRQGKTHLDDQGYLLDDHENFFLDTKGEPVLLDKALPYTVTEEGAVYQENALRATLGIRAFESVSASGEHYYRPQGNEITADATVRQGFVEASNLNATEGMISLIEAQRRFEIYGNLIRSLDQLEQKANEIGRA